MSWIKYSTTLHDKPRVQRSADELNISRFDAAGRLCAVWVWADTMTKDGVIAFGSLAQVDRAAEVEGFGKAMMAVGWLELKGDDLIIPDWELHHSASAKRRGDGAKRAARLRHEKAENKGKTKKRAQRAHEEGDESVRSVRTKTAPRGEERRVEENVVASATTTAPALLAPFGYEAADAEAVERNIGLQAVIDIVESVEAYQRTRPGTIKSPNGWVRAAVQRAQRGEFEPHAVVAERRQAQQAGVLVEAQRQQRMAEVRELDERTQAESERVAEIVDGLSDEQWAQSVQRALEETKGTPEGTILEGAVQLGMTRFSKAMRIRVAEMHEREAVA